MNIVPEQEIEIIFIDEMPCIVLDDCKPIRGAWSPTKTWSLFIVDETTGKLTEQAPPIPSFGPGRPRPMPRPRKDFTQLQKERTQEFTQELLDEIKKHGFHFY